MYKFSVELQENRPHAFGADHANDLNIVKGKGVIDFLQQKTINTISYEKNGPYFNF